MSELWQALQMLPVTAFVAAAVYVPLLLYQRRKAARQQRRIPVLKHVASYVFIGYMLMLVWVVFFWRTNLWMLEYGYRSINLTPFRDVIFALAQGESLLASQYVLNILMFVPLGLLLPVVFPRGYGKMGRVLATGLLATLAIEGIQYFTGRSADIDDVIANVLGCVLGYCLFVLLHQLAGKSRRWKELGCSARLPWPAAAVMAAVLVLTPAGIQLADGWMPYGLTRYCEIPLPTDTLIEAELSREGGEATVYRADPVDTAVLEETLKGYFMAQGYDEFLFHVRENGTWDAWNSGGEEKPWIDEEECRVRAKGLVQGLLFEEETAQLTQLSIQNQRRWYVRFMPESMAPEGRITGYIQLILYPDGSPEQISWKAVRGTAEGTVAVISPAQAAEAAASMGRDWPETLTITGAELDYVYSRGYLLPGYRLEISAELEGEKWEFDTRIDGVKRW